MFDKVVEFWKGKDFLSEVLSEFKSMLEDAHNMFSCVCQQLLHQQQQSDLRNKVYGVDKRINVLEKEIRKRVIEHLSFNPSNDVSMSLVLMSVVKDAERLGDYAKNLFEVVNFIDSPIDEPIKQQLVELEKKINDLFLLTEKAFIDSDTEKAHLCWDIKKEVNKKCNKLVEEIVNSSYRANQAVSYVLIARYFKRIGSHLTNIATSVIVPIDQLDYFVENKQDREEKEI